MGVAFLLFAELYMIQDNSVDFQDTWSFMSRRFEDTKTVTRSRKQFDEFVGGAFNLGVAAFTTVSAVMKWVWLVVCFSLSRCKMYLD